MVLCIGRIISLCFFIFLAGAFVFVSVFIFGAGRTPSIHEGENITTLAWEEARGMAGGGERRHGD
jgi:hypothetical protein